MCCCPEFGCFPFGMHGRQPHLRKNVRSSYSGISPSGRGSAASSCNPKPTHAFQTQMFLGWVTVKTATHQVHLATFTLLRTTEPNMVLQGCITEIKDSPAILGMSHECLSFYWESGIFFKNMARSSLWDSQLTLELISPHSWLDSAVTFCILIFCRVVYGFKQAVPYYGM